MTTKTLSEAGVTSIVMTDGRCRRCGSYAINHHQHGRDGNDGDLCDVCYWRKRAEGKVDLVKLAAHVKYTYDPNLSDTDIRTMIDDIRNWKETK